jgi:fumarate reductase subunit D
MSESLVVYRNPLEQAMWDNIMVGGEWVSIMSSVVLIAIGFVIAYHLLEILGSRFRKLSWLHDYSHSNKRIFIAVILGIFIGKVIKIFFLVVFPMFIEFLMFF